MAATSSHSPANRFVAVARRVYNPIGFSKGYNFILFFIFAGALMGFVLARFQFMDFYGVFCGPTPSSECYHYTEGSVDKAGIIMHLSSILPAGFLACLQFVPVIRHKVILFHRLNGYVVMLLSLVSTAGVLMVARNAAGGGIEVQLGVGVSSIAFIGSMGLAYYNVKRLQIEQHRAWMLRAWFYAGSIITLRIILILMMVIISGHGYFAPIACGQLEYLLKSKELTLQKYPECERYFSNQNPQHAVAVSASMNDGLGAQASFVLTFGAAFWLAFILHAVGVEVYLRLTPAETERLRTISYQRQVEAGMKDPGRAGLTADRLGYSALWAPKE